MKISFHQISLVVIAVATSFGYSASVSAQQLRAENIDEIVKALTLEEKCHLVLGRGMHFNDDAKFPGTAGSTFSVGRLGIPETYCADSQQGLRMNATRVWDHNDYYPTDFVASMTLASTWDREAAFKVGQGIGNEKASAWKTDAGRYDFLICSSASDVEAKATATVKAWSKKVNNVMKPNVKLNLLKR